jgi:hypothetical protein
MTEVILNLPAPLMAHTQKLGLATQRSLDTVLTDTLAMLWLTLEEIPGTLELPVSELLNNAILEISDAKMNEAQNQRLGDLQTNDFR